jgi:hypothetical protein
VKGRQPLQIFCELLCLTNSIEVIKYFILRASIEFCVIASGFCGLLIRLVYFSEVQPYNAPDNKS